MGSRLPGDGLSASEMAMYEYIQRRVRPAAELNIFAITVDGMQIAAMMNFDKEKLRKSHQFQNEVASKSK